MEDYLYLVKHSFDLRIHSFVLMSNHFHLLVTAPNGNISEAMRYFMRETSREITRLSGRINQTYGARHGKTCIGSFHHFMNAYKYVYRNPVRAKICGSVEEYPYSTLHGLCGLRKLLAPVEDDTILFTPEFDQAALNWLNKPSNPELEEEMRLALRRPLLEFKTRRKSQKPPRLDDELL